MKGTLEGPGDGKEIAIVPEAVYQPVGRQNFERVQAARAEQGDADHQDLMVSLHAVVHERQEEGKQRRAEGRPLQDRMVEGHGDERVVIIYELHRLNSLRARPVETRHGRPQVHGRKKPEEKGKRRNGDDYPHQGARQARKTMGTFREVVHLRAPFCIMRAISAARMGFPK